MKSKALLGAVLLVSMAYAREPKHYQSGVLLQMDSVSCGTEEKTGQSVASEMLGTDSAHKKTQEVLCQEYVVQSDRAIFHIRPREEKHPVLLPVGGIAMFRIDKDKMILRSEDLDDKEREYNVISIAPRPSTSDSGAQTSASRLNHMQ